MCALFGPETAVSGEVPLILWNYCSAVCRKRRSVISLTRLPLGVIVQTCKKVSVSEPARMSGEMVDKFPNYEVIVVVLRLLEIWKQVMADVTF